MGGCVINLNPGCRVFQPPEGGAFVCLRMADFVIYCSVLCDINREFSTFPVNPYLCGVPSDFKWSDFTNVTHYELPKCTGQWLNGIPDCFFSKSL